VIKVLTLDELGKEKWDLFVSNHRHSSIFHTSAWHRTIETSYQYETKYHVVQNPDGTIRSAIPSMTVRNLFLGKRTVCFPYSDHCDPLLGDPSDFERLTKSVINTAPNGNVEFRFYKVNRDVPGLNKDESYVNYVLPLREPVDENFFILSSSFFLPESINHLYNNLHNNLHPSCIQRQIRKAQKNGVTVREGKSISDLKQFCNLHLLTRKRHGIPSQSFRFFKNLRSEFGNAFRLFIAEYEEKPVAAMILLDHILSSSFFLLSSSFYKYGASNQAGLRLGANPLLFWHAIKSAAESGLSELDLGRTSKWEKNLAVFKQRLGSVRKPFAYFASTKSISSLQQSKADSMYSKINSFFPASFNQISGALLYRFLG